MLRVNFLNQIEFLLFLINFIKKYSIKICFISSYNVLASGTKASFGYALSKALLFSTFRIFNRYKLQNSIIVKCAIFGGVNTKMYSKSLKFIKEKNPVLKLVRKMPLSKHYVSEQIINFLKNDKKMLFLPKKFKIYGIYKLYLELFGLFYK